MPILQEVEKIYNQFLNDEIHYELSNGVNINLIMKKKHLPHLVGITKLKSHPTIQSYDDENNYNVTSENLFTLLISEGLMFRDITRYPECNQHLRNRLTYFTEDHLKALLFRQVTFIFDTTVRKTKNTAQYSTLFEKVEDGKKNKFIHFMISKSDHYDYYFPISFKAEDTKDSCLTKPIRINRIKHYSSDGYQEYDIAAQKESLRNLKATMKDLNKKTAPETTKEAIDLMRSDFEKHFKECLDSHYDFIGELNHHHNLKLKTFIEQNKFNHLLN